MLSGSCFNLDIPGLNHKQNGNTQDGCYIGIFTMLL